MSEGLDWALTTCFFCSTALREDRLLLVQTGSSSPCLDLR